MMYNGYQILTNPNLVTVKTIPIEKSWLQRVIEWNPCNVEFIKPDYIIEHEPSREMFIMESEKKMVCHPVVFAELKLALGMAEHHGL